MSIHLIFGCCETGRFFSGFSHSSRYTPIETGLTASISISLAGGGVDFFFVTAFGFSRFGIGLVSSVISSNSHIGSALASLRCSSGAMSSLTLPNTGCFRQSTHSGAESRSIALRSRSKAKFSGVSGVIVHWFERFGLLLAISPIFFNFATMRVAVAELTPILAPS